MWNNKSLDPNFAVPYILFITKCSIRDVLNTKYFINRLLPYVPILGTSDFSENYENTPAVNG